MSLPYLSDVINTIFGTRWHIPLPTFGIMVVIAVGLATTVAIRLVKTYEELLRLPSQANTVVTDMALISTLCGIIGARVFDVIAPDQMKKAAEISQRPFSGSCGAVLGLPDMPALVEVSRQLQVPLGRLVVAATHFARTDVW